MPHSPAPAASKLSSPIDLLRVRKLFAAPDRVRESDFLRREIAARMHERLALIKLNPEYILDAGCGEGADLTSLQKRYNKARMLGLDASHAMLLAAREQHASAWSALDGLLSRWMPGNLRGGKATRPHLACGDFAQLPFGGNMFDLVWSNLALHWHPQPDRVFAEWRRVLRIDGLLMFSCFGPDTFKELRVAFAAIDYAPHTLSFVDMHDFGDMLGEAGFSTPVMDMESITVTYESVDRLLMDMRAWGGNPLATRRRGLVGRDAWDKAIRLLGQNRQQDGRIPLTFEIIYGHAFKPLPRSTASGESIIRFDLPRKK